MYIHTYIRLRMYYTSSVRQAVPPKVRSWCSTPTASSGNDTNNNNNNYYYYYYTDNDSNNNENTTNNT